MGLNAADGTSGSGSTGSSGTANCSTVGETQEKYTADSNCGYSTQTRTCCSNKYWSGWDEPCPGAVQLVVVRSTEMIELDCGGVVEAKYSKTNTALNYVTCGLFRPIITVPYPKCPETNICDGKSVGYKCYESYSPQYKENDSWLEYNKGCNYKYVSTSNSYAMSLCESGTASGGGSGFDREIPGPSYGMWLPGNFAVNIVTCQERGSGTGGSTSTGGGSQI